MSDEPCAAAACLLIHSKALYCRFSASTVKYALFVFNIGRAPFNLYAIRENRNSWNGEKCAIVPCFGHAFVMSREFQRNDLHSNFPAGLELRIP